MVFAVLPFVQPRFDVLTKYYRGRVVRVAKSEHNHLHITIDDAKSLFFLKDGGHCYRPSYHDEMYFIVPKYLYRLVDSCLNDMFEGNEYIFQLQEDSKTKKLVVKEVFDY